MDAYKVALERLQTLKIGQYGKVKDFAPNNPDLFIQIVKGLIRSGWCEYEFSNDYTAIRRLDLPDHAKDYFTQFQKLTTKQKQNGKQSTNRVNSPNKTTTGSNH